jgi:hypothetical protein
MAHAVGVWPWCDVFMSGETRNLLLSTLSAGLVGVGDKLGFLSASNLLKSVRPDGVIVKPDAPLAPVDDTYVNDAWSLGKPFVAATATDHGGSKAVYVFSYAENPSNTSVVLKPSDFGIPGPAYVYDYFKGSAAEVEAGGDSSFLTSMPDVANGGRFHIIVPIGKSGMAFLGDAGKFATRGKKRIAEFSDDGKLNIAAVFAAGETNVVLTGWAPSLPRAAALSGAAGSVNYNPATRMFTVGVSPDASGNARIEVSLDSGAPLSGAPK